MASVEARRRGQRIGDVVIGVILTGAGGLWTVIWGGVAVLASTFGGETFGWLIVAAAVAVGIYVFFLGISFVRGSPSFGGIVRFGTIGLVVTPILYAAVIQARDDRDAAPVNRVVERQYMKRGAFVGVDADCARISGNPDGSEDWICDISTESVYDTCLATVRTLQAGNITARLYGCDPS